MPLQNPRAWGSLKSRYESERPRRVLALDGGGIRGLMTVQVLIEMEDKLREKYGGGDDFRLCHFFDYVGGTSTGAIIAAGIARGMSAREIHGFYKEFGEIIFTKRRWGIWNALYQDGPLVEKLKQVFGTDPLGQSDLKCLLLVVTRNATTDSAWPISTNPDAKFNAPERADNNLQIPLWQIVRASTAAPVYFPPEVIEWDKENPDKSFVFVDGGTTSYNNPAFLLARMATEPRYNLGWRRGEEQLLVVSIGTGDAPNLGADIEDPESNLLSSAKNTLSSLMTQAAFDQDVNCRTVGRCTYGNFIDLEVDDMIPRDADGNEIPISEDIGRSFLYARYNATLTRDWLNTRGLGNIDPEKVSKLDSTDGIDDLEAIGKELGKDFDLAHFGKFVDEPLFEVS